MKRWIAFLAFVACVLCCGLNASAQELRYAETEDSESMDPSYGTADQQQRGKAVNFGIRAGFNSTMFNVSSLGRNGVKVSNPQNNYRIGYLGALFMRVNMGKCFVQPEISYSHTSCNMTFDVPLEDADQVVSVTSTMNSLEMPVLFGYNVIKQDPYSLALMIGPKVRYMWNTDNTLSVEGDDMDAIHEELYPFCFSLSFGVAVTISKVFFDFRYDIGLHNISRKLLSESSLDNETTTTDLQFKRHENTLSFSVGLFF